MTATYPTIGSYPDCPTCGRVVADVEHESIDDDRHFDASFSVHSKGQSFLLKPCGHEMSGCVITDPESKRGLEVTEWLTGGQP